MTDVFEFGIGTRRRPIGRDYAAAKDIEEQNKNFEFYFTYDPAAIF